MGSVPDEFVPFSAPQPLADRPKPEDPSLLQILPAAGTLANWPYRTARYLENRFGADFDPSHNPYDAIKGTKYETDPERFAFSRDEQETRAIMAEWDADQEAADILARSGKTGTVAAVGMGMLDPTIFLPVAKVFTGAKTGASIARLSADVALAAGASAAIGEAAMMATTPGYDSGDVAFGIGSATILGGLIGAGAGALITRAERKTLAAALDADRAAWAADTAAPSAPGAASAGAAAADTRELTMRTPGFLKSLPDPMGKIAPPKRVLNSGLAEARRTVVDLVETPYIFDENVEGIATTQGPAVDRLVKMEAGKGRVALAQQFDTAYARYRFGAAPDGLKQVASQKLTRLMDHVNAPEGKATFGQFREMVDDALRNNDTHAIPEVAETAAMIRSKVLAPWRDRAIKAGLLPEGVDAATADSYMMRVWNKQALTGERPRAVATFADWLQGEEMKKAGLQADLQRQADLLEIYDDAIAGLEGRAAGREDTLAAVKARADEMQRLNRFSFSRANTLREALTDANAKRSAARAGEGAGFERQIRGRGNVLADQASAKQAVIDDLQQRAARLAAERDSLRADIEANLGKWDGASARPAKAALKSRDALPREPGKARLTAADGDVDAAVRRILAKPRRTDRKEAEALAQEIIGRIIGTPDGRLPYDVPTARPDGMGGGGNPDARGPLAARTFMIPDALVKDFIERDALNTAQIYLNTMAPDVILTERFGDIRMTEAFKKIADEAAAKIAAAKTPKERARIEATKQAVLADLAAMRDRIRHVYGYSSDPRQRLMGRAAATAARYDIMTNLGGTTFASFADLAGIQWRYGLTSAFKNAWAPFMKAMVSPETRKGVAAYREQMRSLGIAAETYLNTRSSGLNEVIDVYRPASRFERGMTLASEKFGLANLLTPWTDFGKTAASMVSGTEITRAVKAVAAGKALPRQIRDLAENGIDAAMATRIAEQLDAPGGSDLVGGISIPNSGLWKDVKAAEAFEGALARDVDIMIITPGAEKPLMMSRPVASLILQYKSFVAAANERLLVRSLQARDRQVLQGMVSAIGLGILAEYANNIAAGRESPKTAADLIKAGISRSGIMGWYTDANALSSKWTGGTADAFRLIGTTRPDSRYISRSKLGALLGPTSGKVENLLTIGSDLANMKWTAMDTERLRRFMIGQNLFYIRRLLDGMVDAINEAGGLEPIERKRPGG